MILQALNEYYERKAEEVDPEVPPYGYSEQGIAFALTLTPTGELRGLLDLRQEQRGRLVPRRMLVPAPVKRTVKVVPQFLWDNTMYVLGLARDERKDKPQRVSEAFEAFRALHRQRLEGCGDEGALALVAFLEGWDPERAAALDLVDDLRGANVVFRLERDGSFLHDRPALRTIWRRDLEDQSAGARVGQCLVTGERAALARIHPDLKGIAGAQAKGASLVSFNLDAFTSYGKDQNLNAPVSERAAFGYTTALNHLLRRDSRQRVRLGDATVVFWAEADGGTAERLVGLLFDPASAGAMEPQATRDDAETTAVVRTVLEAARGLRSFRDVSADLDEGVRFYILGLSPNNARVSVRLWYVSTFGEIARRFARYYGELAIERAYPTEPELPPAWMLLRQTAAEGKAENIPPLLAGALARSVLTGAPYPEILYSTVLGRIRADHVINYYRASVIKAYLIRNCRKEVSMSLDVDRPDDPAYRMGRTFALLEQVQRNAVGGSSTIRDRFFASASATPRSVFPNLLRMAQHHLGKLGGQGIWLDKAIQGALDGVNGFPAHLSPQEQGLFVLGYYHQKNAIFTKRPENAEANSEEE